MSPDEREELIDFILQSQANTADKLEVLTADHKVLTADVSALASICQGLVEVARRHDRRLDGLEGLNP